MAAILIDGKRIANRLTEQVAVGVADAARAGWMPGLAVVLVGDDPASHVYVRSKGKQTVAAGMRSFVHHLPSDASEVDLLNTVDRLNRDPAVDGILVQLPLPRHIDGGKILATIDPSKDVDGFHAVNAGRLATGDKSGLVPCTPLGCIHLIKSVRQDLSGAHAVVLGRSNIVGKPVAQLLLRENCTITVAHSHSRNVDSICRGADVLIAAVGQPEVVRGSWIRPGAIVVDVGINRIADKGASRLAGDVAFAEAREIASAITPVPGGVGPMTIAYLLHNTLRAAQLRRVSRGAHTSLS
ncbi:bifunctional methylenetetrahydrofolate dehydrogenase/methenyltetrahydrofolate cyclohydrolase FolD [Bradyrhizobium liaoningense]|uniref:bifunctional methylenetetrahydrofolate dehydrogenase/methenyltetrahydrofolate cyclohydrolase FolD n=1 Tax=Bradyrhizobium liaoningense TaxID=43992 RepID=UPI001BA879A2|nr:bifunctional methylenetetrahydrofolate dehydrogenase/methenyltetrahydrofolate cyclohydrolase FolD [Bradyrhizobium liaoningense]MBR0859130.1 bifunctional methylenetetrahydrofolate dehydrogenase/methenyltetrahydrofolate cyclohydrolase FolD [Bradyrhizobium liaoningense]